MKKKTAILLDILLTFEKYKDCFFKNVFRSNLKRIKRNEMNYLMILSDSTHNFSDCIKKLIDICNGKETDMSSLVFYIKEMELFQKIISDENYIRKYGIKINNTIRSWMFELTRIKQYGDMFIERIKAE